MYVVANRTRMGNSMTFFADIENLEPVFFFHTNHGN
jgi:hypothetical protein